MFHSSRLQPHRPSTIPVQGILLAVALFGAATASRVQADPFDDHTAYWLRQGIEAIQPREQLEMRDALSLDLIGKRILSPCIVVKTDEDNLTKALVTWGFRKHGDQQIPVVMIERYVTYRGDRPNLTTATGRDVMLFPGFQFNFDIGQVVPEGLGGDIACGDMGLLKPVGMAQLFGLNGPATPAPEPGSIPDPDSHEGVIPTDFAGAWDVHIDGRWDGRWELNVDERQIFGKFLSKETASVYEVNGKVAGLPHNARLNIELANAAQTVDAYLWTKDKSAMAGTVTMNDRKLGFFALRIKPEAAEPPPQ